jgi:hypothetical protein
MPGRSAAPLAWAVQIAYNEHADLTVKPGTQLYYCYYQDVLFDLLFDNIIITRFKVG